MASTAESSSEASSRAVPTSSTGESTTVERDDTVQTDWRLARGTPRPRHACRTTGGGGPDPPGRRNPSCVARTDHVTPHRTPPRLLRGRSRPSRDDRTERQLRRSWTSAESAPGMPPVRGKPMTPTSGRRHNGRRSSGCERHRGSIRLSDEQIVAQPTSPLTAGADRARGSARELESHDTTAFSVQMPALRIRQRGTVTRWLKKEVDICRGRRALAGGLHRQGDTRSSRRRYHPEDRRRRGRDHRSGGELALIDDGSAGSDDSWRRVHGRRAGPTSRTPQTSPRETSWPRREVLRRPGGGEGTDGQPELASRHRGQFITKWLKSVGDTVEIDEPPLEVSTDKVDTEIPSRRRHHPEDCRR